MTRGNGAFEDPGGFDWEGLFLPPEAHLCFCVVVQRAHENLVVHAFVVRDMAGWMASVSHWFFSKSVDVQRERRGCELTISPLTAPATVDSPSVPPAARTAPAVLALRTRPP